jgi:hypothetical protein
MTDEKEEELERVENNEPWREHFSRKDLLLVRFMHIAGCTQDTIAQELGISRKSLKKYFGEELVIGESKLNSQMVGAIFKSAMNGNFQAQRFWAVCRMGWKETTAVEHSGNVTPVLNIITKDAVYESKLNDNSDDDSTSIH